jgi:hypothetical protein
VVLHRAKWGLLLVAALCAGSATAQISAAASAELQLMASHASVIFTGQVVDIARNDGAGFVDIRFHLDQSLRGAPNSGSYVLREWAGLWTGNPDRYHVGQRKLMLLPARGPAGMSCPIGGTDGAIPIVAISAAASPNTVDAASVTDAVAVDLRWIQARAQRSGTAEAPSAQARVTAVGRPVKPSPAPAAQTAPLASVLALLTASPGATDARY